MAWIRVESSVRTHPKFLAAGPHACWLWICALGYCQEGLTDGLIPTQAIDYLGVPNAKQLASVLVEAGLFDCTDFGWLIHDYLDHNKSAADIRTIQRERRTAGAIGGKASAQSRQPQPNTGISGPINGQANAKQVAEANPNDLLNPSTALISSVQLSGTEKISTAAAPRKSQKELAKEPHPNGNYRVIEKLALESLRGYTPESESDFIDQIKTECAKRHIRYDGEHDLVHRACSSALIKAKLHL